MNFPLDVVVIVTIAAVGVGIAFTVRAFSPRSHHDHATTDRLKRFFNGKECAICKRPIPPVHVTGLKPGLLNRTTNETYSWEAIQSFDLSTALETMSPICSECEVAESFRQRFPGLVVDRDQHPASPAPAAVKNPIATE